MKTELRLNNYVFGVFIEETDNADIEEKCICSVDVIDGVGCTEYNIWASSIEDKGKLIEEWERFEPIPLTEKWLLDFGYIKDDTLYGMYWHNKYDRHYIHIVSPINIHWGNQKGSIKMFDYVHQLQNIFFIMIEEELTINTPTSTSE